MSGNQSRLTTKKILPYLLLLFACTLAAQTTPIPDANFEQELIDLGIDTNGLTRDILDSDATTITTITITRTDITDFSGLEIFVDLTDLNLGSNNFTTVPLSTLTLLENLSFANNDVLATLDLSQNANLKTLFA
ncbi:hypothetical protein [Maribacter halichondriae]|uniref:hypothetical protein n=1 Tax=Maribacter halichondriae TaxID=2980554 RepID=UPI0023597C61|nr:hypothetical protein [Maribacter sp. Hal144]